MHRPWFRVVLAAALAGAAEARLPVAPFESDADPVPTGRIDEGVCAQVEGLGIAPARPCSDGVFGRRVYLDITGTLPTADNARQFFRDPDPEKHRKLVGRGVMHPANASITSPFLEKCRQRVCPDRQRARHGASGRCVGAGQQPGVLVPTLT